MSFLAGRYTATLNSLALGQTAEGFRLSWQVFKRLITGDAFGEGKQDGIYRGMDLFLAYQLLEFNAAGALTAMWPYSSTFLDASGVGKMDVVSSLAKALVMTAIAGTPAAATPATMTFPTVALAEGFNVDVLYAPDLREVPIRQRIYPNASLVFGTTT